MVTAKLRPSQVLINETAIAHNVQHAIAGLPQGTELFAVVKADAYGHGLLRVARIAQAAGATGFCVAILDEALALRRAGFTLPILVLGIIEPEYAPIAAANHIVVPVGSSEWLTQALPGLTSGRELPPLHVHLALDTGMGRIGFRQVTALNEAIAVIRAHAAQVKVTGLFTHFSTADDPDPAYFKMQVTRFHEFLDALPERPRYVHVANSATSLWHAACDGNLVRFGVAMYGLNPSGRAIDATPYPLEPALTLTSTLSFVKQIEAGEAVSYGATYHAAKPEWIGTVPLGYADGWQRRLQGFHVLVNGTECEIVGRVCMDQFMIRLPGKVKTGTPVVLIGRSGDQEITLQDVADYAHTIHYEIACGLTERLPRVSVAPFPAQA
ncbi:alanine racemase [Lacticaseibacillus camelliae]|uniref:Alanine racemase n=1 Tax=Lacticaseibacillus camelliae DSM 22697 = JCM 13995 TaxID=1423730 RepID=A0A0R2FBU6_9LACO|nr:alanine racemase [Lacticaseibacillus camelliae]KRN25951.1 alanine racemase [Lacticaseibacillus camelliae DSM 22697 = JCM 13995]